VKYETLCQGPFCVRPVYVDVIESISDKAWSTGMALNPENRLAEHNAAKNRFTKSHRLWKLIFTEQHLHYTY
jgi:predicted GIY-YIG superfamily endonuclease